MTTAEFDRWWADMIVRFPSVDAWVVKATSDQNTQRQLLRNWCIVFQDVAIGDAIEVNRQMQSGELPWVGEYDNDKERLPQHVRRLARTLAAERMPRTQEPLGDLKPTSFPAGKIMRAIFELTDKGVSREDAIAAILKEMPVGKPNYEPRYRCCLCRDIGDLIVASASAIRAMLCGEFDKCRHRDAAVRCKCREHIQQNPKRKIVIYDASRDFMVFDSLWPASQVNDFARWCEAQQEAFWNSKRESEFDRFNQREFAP